MADNLNVVIKSLSPRIAARALMALDKSTAVVVGFCWLAAIVTLVTAMLSVHGAVAAKRAAAEAVASEPVLPQSSSSRANEQDVKNILDRLQRQFPDIKFDVDGNQLIYIQSSDGSKFHEWVMALSYVDALAPHYRWTLTQFCVGHCGDVLMRATVSGQKVVYTLPEAGH